MRKEKRMQARGSNTYTRKKTTIQKEILGNRKKRQKMIGHNIRQCTACRSILD
jgi:hypothetical protein